MTNVDESISLTWQQWGDFFGFEHDYWERGSYFRQWWLVSEWAIVFITYQSDSALKTEDTEEVDKIIRSITIKTP